MACAAQPTILVNWIRAIVLSEGVGRQEADQKEELRAAAAAASASLPAAGLAAIATTPISRARLAHVVEGFQTPPILLCCPSYGHTELTSSGWLFWRCKNCCIMEYVC